MKKRPRHLLRLADWSPTAVAETLDLALRVKRDPAAYAQSLAGRTLIMLFEKPSLRTRVSFETGMFQLGGQAIHYDLSTSPLGAGKESPADTARVLSRYVDVIMARLFAQRTMNALARHATAPVINGLTNESHPTQVLADLLTIRERRGKLAGLTLAYFGDARNNVTHSLLVGGALTGLHVTVACPAAPDYSPDPAVMRRAQAIARRSGARLRVVHDAAAAARGADILYTDSWMSYHIAPEAKERRLRDLKPFQVNRALLRRAGRGALFMNCLPALRGFEQTAEVIDGPQSVVFDEAENRLHAHKAILLYLLGKD